MASRNAALACGVLVFAPSCRGDSADAAPAPWWQQPWVAPAGPWSRCENHPHAQESLKTRAAYYDWVAKSFHLLPETDRFASLVFDVTLSDTAPEEQSASLPEVSHYHFNENAGLLSSLYLASQAFRYAATGEEAALHNVRRVLAGLEELTQVTGVPGLYARHLRGLGPNAWACPVSPLSYRPPDENMVGNFWVRLDDQACAWVWDEAANDGAGAWREEGHCTDPKIANGCWQRNVSKDEYSGNLFALGVVARLIDVKAVRNKAIELLDAAARHLVENDLLVRDYDGRATRFGRVYALTIQDFPGLNALMSLAWMRMAATLTEEEDYLWMFEECLLQTNS